jgi:hypothetical protein
LGYAKGTKNNALESKLGNRLGNRIAWLSFFALIYRHAANRPKEIKTSARNRFLLRSGGGKAVENPAAKYKALARRLLLHPRRECCGDAAI